MESNRDVARQIRDLERGEAAPYVDIPPSPFWAAPAYGAWFAAYVGAFALWSAHQLLFIVAMLVLVGAMSAFLGWFSSRSGVFPRLGRGRPPREIRREYGFYVGGLIAVVAAVAVSWWWAGPPIASATTLVLVTAGIALYEYRYQRAADAVKARLR
ncbi:hypothetical protein [Flaviflexus equikiangi]|uniref:Uncharacterized protein n=1 Tax=Flaviflexus equikiangi TaxID=2758573 RepID=A0ABS2TID3_9ACTO|nr:hypothetical protein [Flaviflexus equikiangi]MBM9434118.1 hypothetical protein [Flaviflexus equikiangi]